MSEWRVATVAGGNDGVANQGECGWFGPMRVEPHDPAMTEAAPVRRERRESRAFDVGRPAGVDVVEVLLGHNLDPGPKDLVPFR